MRYPLLSAPCLPGVFEATSGVAHMRLKTLLSPRAAMALPVALSIKDKAFAHMRVPCVAGQDVDPTAHVHSPAARLTTCGCQIPTARVLVATALSMRCHVGAPVTWTGASPGCLLAPQVLHRSVPQQRWRRPLYQ